MKMNKKVVIGLIFAVLIAFGFGVSGVVDLAKAAPENAGDIGDQLIGVFVTGKSLEEIDFEEDLEEYFKENISDIVEGNEIHMEYSGSPKKVYAKEVPYPDEPNLPDYEFEGIDGIKLLYNISEDNGVPVSSSSQGSGISDVTVKINEGEDADSYKLEGTVYGSKKDSWEIFYVNPIYKTAEGKVYTVSTMGDAYSPGEKNGGMTSTHTLAATSKIERGGKTRTLETEIKVNIEFIDETDYIYIVQFDKEDKVLSKDTYGIDSIPREIAPLKDTQYFVVEALSGSLGSLEEGKVIDRQIFGNEDDEAGNEEKFVRVYSTEENGICIAHDIPILWK